MSKSNNSLTPNDIKALQVVELLKGTGSRPSIVGVLLYPSPREGVKYDNRSRQGLALAGSKAMNRLKAMGLIRITSTLGGETQYSLTGAGAATLKEDKCS